MARTGNPIPFNPDLMSVQQAKDCADTLSMAFASILRCGTDDEANALQIVHQLEEARRLMLAKYGHPA